MKLVDVYGISMIAQLKDDLESDKVCVNIGMCYSEESNGFVQIDDGTAVFLIKGQI